VIRTYQYRLYPTNAQTAALNGLLETGRQFYNYALQYRRERWEESRYHVTYNEQAGLWRDWRNEQPEDNPLRLLNMSAGQQLLRRLDKAYQAFFRRVKAGETPGHPRFKGKNRFHSLEYKHGDGCKLRTDEQGRALFYVQNVGEIKVKYHRPLPAGCTIKHLVIKRSLRKWFICLQLELTGAYTPQRPVDHPVGIDMGLLSLLALSDEHTIDNPRWLRQSQADLRVKQRTLSRRKKGSRRRHKAAFQVAKLHEKIAHQRSDFWHKETGKLADKHSLIGIEDLHLQFMTQNGHLALSAHDAALGQFRQLLAYKAEEAGTQVIAVNPKGTSQVCSGCGVVVPKELKVRTHDCPHCGLTLNRDVNAARNILNLALQSARTEPSGANVADYRVRSLRSSPL
jgi:putative transposase